MAGSTIVIEYDGTDITGSCVFAECTFEAQMAAIPGTFAVAVKDPDQTLDFTTGKILTLDVDGVRLYGGYVLQVSKTYFFPADDTAVIGEVRSRKWVLEGVDFNILFDKRVLRKTTAYTTHIPSIAPTTTDGGLIRTYFDNFFDLPAGFDFSDPAYVLDNHTYTVKFPWPTQGSTMRQVLDLWGLYGAVYWIDANKQFNFIPVQETLAQWGFSDRPNNNAIGVGTPTRGFFNGSYTEDASSVVNDALVWGGSEWAANGDVVFARRDNATSISNYGRWQVGEVLVGNANYKSQAEVTARAKVIVDGNESGTFAEGSQGLVNPEKQFRCSWWSIHVPESGGNPVHLRPGQVVPVQLYVFSEDGGVTPFEALLPLRQVVITFPGLDANGDAYVQFDGFFGVLMSDPKWLWTYLRKTDPGPASTYPVPSNVDDGSEAANPGGATTGTTANITPTPAPDGVATVFTTPYGYYVGTLEVYLNGILQRPGIDFTETDNVAGEFTMASAPISTDILHVVFMVLAVPGANYQGFGSLTTGGEGYTVVHVTNLNNSGAGSLRAALEGQSDRHIVFDVAGEIALTDYLEVTGSNITVDGATAPSGRITFTGWPIRTRDGAHDIIYTHFRHRGGWDGTGGSGGEQDADCMATFNGCYNIIYDHLSLSGWWDEGIQTNWGPSGSYDLTVQWCIIGGPPGNDDHYFASVANVQPRRITYHHNLFFETPYRNPNIGYYSNQAGADSGLRPNEITADIVNNVMWNIAQYGVTAYEGAWVNAVGNYFTIGEPSWFTGSFLANGNPENMLHHETEAQLYTGGGNLIDGANGDGYGNHAAFSVASYAAVNTTSATTAAYDVVAGAGCRPLDSIDIASLATITLP